MNGKNIRKSATSKSCLCNCKNASNFRSSRSNSSRGAASRKCDIFGRTLQKNEKRKRKNIKFILNINRLKEDYFSYNVCSGTESSI